MPTTQLFAVRRGLETLFGKALDGTGTVVFDGPRSHGEMPKKFLTIGTDGGDTGTGEGSGDTSTATLARSQYSATDARDETATVTCAVWRWSGEADDLPQLRLDVETVLDLCVEAVTTDRTLGGVLDPNDDGAYVASVRITEQQTTAGPFVRAAFDINYGALLI